jgi:signal transduction histidine kinase/CheY-like chemotaxis protein
MSAQESGIKSVISNLMHKRSFLKSAQKVQLSEQAIASAVTAQRKCEAELATFKQLAEQDKLSRLKVMTAANHDLSQPLHAMGLFINMLEQSSPTPHQSEILSNIKLAFNSHTAMRQAIAEFTHVDIGNIKPQLQPFALQHLFNKLERTFADEANDKDLVYRSRETALRVYSDAGLIESILSKLISNAIQYTPNGSLLVAARKHDNRALIEVFDTGIGIEPARHDTIFVEYKLSNSNKLNEPSGLGLGLGLGLAIANGLAQTLGHELTFTSIPQRGSVFRLSIPLADDIESQPESTIEPVSKLIYEMRGLIIEDEMSMRRYLQELFSQLGCQCDAATSIENAHALAQARKPDFIISDYWLNDTHTGIEAINSLRKQLCSNLPALLITGLASLELILEAHENNIHVLHKPFKPDELHLALMRTLNQIH